VASLVDQQALRRVVREFGPSLLAYVCNVPQSQAGMLVDGSYELAEPQARVFEQLVAALAQIRLQAAYDGVPAYLLLAHLRQDVTTDRAHPLNGWRQEAGGALPEPTSDDAVLRPLAELAIADESDARAIADWALSLGTVNDSAIRIAQRRLVSALSRSDPVDGFVDAVVAWENLFGSRQGELGFRISTAMASLLSGDANERLRLQREINKQYNRRSDVVHGSDPPPCEEATDLRNRAVVLALSALRRLYRDFQGLIADSDRARKIVLSP